jgi:hypothetical protein
MRPLQDRLRAARWRAVNYTRDESSVEQTRPGFAYSSQFHFTVSTRHTFLGPRVAGTQGIRRREGAARRSLRSEDCRPSSSCHRGRKSGRRGRPDYAGRPFGRSCSPSNSRTNCYDRMMRRLRSSGALLPPSPPTKTPPLAKSRPGRPAPAMARERALSRLGQKHIVDARSVVAHVTGGVIAGVCSADRAFSRAAHLLAGKIR